MVELTIENVQDFVNDYFFFASAKRKKEVSASFRKNQNKTYTTHDQSVIDQFNRGV